MPFVLMFIGLLLTVVAVRDNQSALYDQLAKDFTGPGNFTVWIVAIVAIGSLGYVKTLKTPVDLLLGLMLIGFIASNASGFTNLLPGIQNAFSSISGGSSTGSPQTGAAILPSVAAPSGGQSSTGSTAQDILNSVTGSDQSLIQKLFQQ